MNLRLVCRLLGIIALLIGGAMIFSLPWAYPQLGYRRALEARPEQFEWSGFFGLLGSMAVCGVVGLVLIRLGRGSESAKLFRKEAMAVVGLSWTLATVLGALPFLFSSTRLGSASDPHEFGPRMTVIDAMFESQSGFSTTGATVISNLENPHVIPHCILFWRSSTHFLGGLGIIVLFVVILGQGSAGKALMRNEMPGPSKEGSEARMQHTAWAFAGVYCGLNAVLVLLLIVFGMSPFDSLCHSFGTLATGGFSTYNASLGHFNSPAIEYTVTLFMLLAGSNFTLLYFALVRLQPSRLFRDVEWRVYASIIVGATLVVLAVGVSGGDFINLGDGLRYVLFQVVSVITTTGYGTHDFDAWNNFGRGVLFLLMFVGGCAGSTGGGIKVIRHILFLKILRLEVELSYHPSVIRPLRLGGEPVEDQELRRNILVYFCLILTIFIFSWMIVVALEPDATWESTGGDVGHKLIDSASGVAATLNNIGPGLGTIGATRNYGHFSQLSKALFTVLMMIGRLEIFAVLVLFFPGFWRAR